MPIRVKQHKRVSKNKVSVVRQHVKKSKPKTKVDKVMKEWKSGTLHSGSKKGAVVQNRKQAIAIALSEAGKTKKSRSYLISPGAKAFLSKGGNLARKSRAGSQNNYAIRRAAKNHLGFSVDVRKKNTKSAQARKSAIRKKSKGRNNPYLNTTGSSHSKYD